MILGQAGASGSALGPGIAPGIAAALLLAAAAWLLAAIAYQIASQIALARLLRRPRGAAPRVPTCSILRPLHGSSPTIEANLDLLLSLGAPVVLGVEDENDLAAGAARRAAARHPGAKVTLCIGPAPRGANRKVANLSRMLPQAAGEIVVITDGDVATPAGYLEVILAPFEDPAVGLVTCPYRSVGSGGLASRVDVLLTNTGFLPSVAVAERVEGVRFALGATIAVRRSVLDAAGGFAPLADLLADDYALAGRVLADGHRTVLAPLLLDHHVEETRLRNVWRRHLRWARTTRAVRPGGYAGTLLTHGVAPAALLALGGGAPGIAGAITWLLVRIGGMSILHRPLGLSPPDLLLMPAADLLAFVLYFGGLIGRSVHWGGERLTVGERGTIRPEAASRHPGPATRVPDAEPRFGSPVMPGTEADR